jgi:hypothetical protein
MWQTRKCRERNVPMVRPAEEVILGPPGGDVEGRSAFYDRVPGEPRAHASTLSLAQDVSVGLGGTPSRFRRRVRTLTPDFLRLKDQQRVQREPTRPNSGSRTASGREHRANLGGIRALAEIHDFPSRNVRKSKTSNVCVRLFRVKVTFARQCSAALFPSTTNEISCQPLWRKLSIKSFMISCTAALPRTSAVMLGSPVP